jgi:hypothetical protein
MGTESESEVPSRENMDLHDLRRIEEVEALSSTWGHVVMLLCHSGVRRGRRD